ncbi:unnamed protein product [Caenorhabditis auriculariae]|uniref:Uncharacterized protein n=1 Tax=Caenorhabditis auriculariae TaxID=2777116 RepID=A0A8S1GZ78_9PELO|nr:unnamed protein product [Caenorhabditis auriculariae]
MLLTKVLAVAALVGLSMAYPYCVKIVPDILFSQLEGESCGFTSWCATGLECVKGMLEDKSLYTCVIPWRRVIVRPSSWFPQMAGEPCDWWNLCAGDLKCTETKRWGNICIAPSRERKVACPNVRPNVYED